MNIDFTAILPDAAEVSLSATIEGCNLLPLYRQT
jgi:hypothetical protein